MAELSSSRERAVNTSLVLISILAVGVFLEHHKWHNKFDEYGGTLLWATGTLMVLAGLQSWCWERERGLDLAHLLIALVALNVYCLVTFLAMWTWLLYRSAPKACSKAGTLRLLGLMALCLRLVVYYAAHNVFENNLSLPICLSTILLVTNMLAASEQRRVEQDEAEQTAEGMEALSIMTTIFTALAALAIWVAGVETETEKSKLMIDKALFTILACGSAIRHVILHREIQDGFTLDIDVKKRSFYTGSVEPLLPNQNDKELLSVDVEGSRPTIAFCVDQVQVALSGRSWDGMKAAAKNFFRAMGAWRKLQFVALMSALSSFVSLVLNIIFGTLERVAWIFVMSARSAAIVGAVVSAILFLVIASSLLRDYAYPAPLKDTRFGITAVLKAVSVVSKLIATFAPKESNVVDGHIFCEDTMCISNITNCSLPVVSKHGGACYIASPSAEPFLRQLLVAATAFSLFVTMVLTLKNIMDGPAFEQLEKKVVRPRIFQVGYSLAWLGSKLGLFFILIGGFLGPRALLAYSQTTVSYHYSADCWPLLRQLWERPADIQVPDLFSFRLILVVTAGMALITLLTNEAARVIEDPRQKFSAARSADGIRAMGDLIIVLLLPAVFFLVQSYLGRQLGWALLATSIGATVALFGVFMMLIAAGLSHKAVAQ